MKVDFTAMTDLRQEVELVSMMRALYAKDRGTSPVDQSRFPVSLAFLISHPSRGRIVLFREGELLCGYALLIPYWSNEFGGTLLFVDEIFIIPTARNQGIGRSFFRHLEQEKPFDAVALALETTPANEAARRLYKSLGFRERENRILTYRFAHSSQKNSSQSKAG